MTDQTATEARTPGEPVCYTLVEWDTDGLESPAVSESGDVMVLGPTPDGGTAWDNAVGMARFILGADHDGDEREERDGLLPVIGILGHDHPNPGEDYDTRDDDAQSWACGWVTLDGEIHEGDYENDAALWDDLLGKNWVANVIGENLIPADLPVEGGPRVLPVGDEGVHVLYGDRRNGVTVLVRATSALDVERRILATFGDGVTVDDCSESVDQTPIAAQVEAFGRPDGGRVYLDVRYDVTDLTVEQRDHLAGEALAQAERSDGHPTVEAQTIWVEA